MQQYVKKGKVRDSGSEMQIDEMESSDETEDIKMRSERRSSSPGDIIENLKAENIADEGSRMGKI